MRLIKMFGLAAIAVGAFMAFVGATSASAVTSLEETVVCSVNETTCASGHVLGNTTKLDAKLVTGSVAKLEAGSLGKVLCTASKTKGEIKSSLAHGEITELKFENCVRDKVLGGTEACEVEEKNLPYLAKVLLANDHSKYHLVVTSVAGGGTPSALVKCGSVINCTFGSTSVLFEVLSGASDVVLDVNQELERSGGVCPTVSTWTAEYLVNCLSGSTEIGCWPAMEEGSVLTVP